MDYNKNNVNVRESSDMKKHLANSEPAKVQICGKETEKELAENIKLEQLSMKYCHRLANQVIYKGVLCNKTITPLGLDSLAEFEMKDGDVIVCGYPKSGGFICTSEF